MESITINIIKTRENKREMSLPGFKKLLTDWASPPDLQVSQLTKFIYLFLQHQLAVKNYTKFTSELENGMSHWPTRSEEGR